MKIIFNFILMILISITFLTNNILNANEREFLVPVDTWAPFRIQNDNKYTGIDFDVLSEIEKRLDLKIKIKKTPWARSLLNMKSGKVDGMTGLAKRKERAEYMHYISPPYYTCSTVFYVKKGFSSIIKNYDDLKKHLIGQVDDSAYFTPYDNDDSLKKHSVKNEVQLVKMLAVGRLKVIIGTDCQVDYDIARMGYQDKIEKAQFRPNNNVDLYFVVSKKSSFSSDLDKISKIIKDIVDEGLVKEFANKYYKK